MFAPKQTAEEHLAGRPAKGFVVEIVISKSKEYKSVL